MADVEQLKKIVPFVTCEIAFSQNVCQLMFGINVSNLNLGVQINSVKHPIQSNSGFLLHVSLRDFGLLLSSDSRLHCHQKCRASHQIKKTSRSTKHNQHYLTQDCCAWLGLWFGFGCACLMWCHATSLLVLDLWFSLIGLWKCERLLTPNPKDQELVFHPCVNLHQEI